MTWRRLQSLLWVTLLLSVFPAGHRAIALDPRFELDTRSLQRKSPAKPPQPPPAIKAPAAPRKAAGETSYTVKPGDHLMKILVRDFGMGNREAHALVPEIKRRNQLGDTGRLKTGMQIIIPLPAKGIRHAAGPARHGKIARPKTADKKTAGYGLALYKNAPQTGNEWIESTRTLWSKLVPAKQLPDDTVSIKGRNYSLDLDPDRFPLFPAADGGKILVEAGESLSPMVKSLIQDHDPGIRFIAYTPHDRKRFYANLLATAGFYSVEENFTVAFGTDPKLTVTTDFKVENDSDSPLHDIFLLNIEPRRGGFPASLTEYLAKQGFRVIDLYPAGQQEKPGTDNRIHVISGSEPGMLADRLMSALDLGYEQNKEIDLLNMREGGVALRVRADRYFEKNGEKFVISVFRGDLENYTLLRLLEAQHYHVIVLTPDENLRSIAGKFISQLHLRGSYDMQELLASPGLPYSIQMSGLMIDTYDKRGKVFLTSSQPDPVIGSLLEINGYAIYDGSEKFMRK